MTAARRFARFNVVSAAGFAVQLATVALLTHWMDLSSVTATGLGVGAAIVHNFLWHRWWTWADRPFDPGGCAPVFSAPLRTPRAASRGAVPPTRSLASLDGLETPRACRGAAPPMSRFRLRRGYGGRAEDAREARAQRRRAVRAGSLTLATSSPAGVALTAATTRTPVVATFLRFAGANGLVSLVGNLFIVAILVEAAGLDVVLANVVAVAICGLLNFQIGDRVVFRAARRAS